MRVEVAAAVIRLNRPAERNPLSLDTLAQLEATLDALAARADVFSIIITGAGDAFASGANIRELAALAPDGARAFSARGQQLMRRLSSSQQLTVAAVNGYCMGGGLDLALACHARVASSRAVFAHPGARLGVITGWGGTQRLPRVVGAARACEMFLTGRRLSAAEALAAGLVNRVGEDALACALTLVGEWRERIESGRATFG